MIALVVAVAHHGVIGRNNTIPWHLPDELRWFRRVTLGKTVIMGRKTWLSLPKRPLPKRTNLVLSRDPTFVAEGATVLTSLEQALAYQAEHSADLMVIGGAELYALFLPCASYLYYTAIAGEIADGDTFFPRIDWTQWELEDETWHSADSDHAYSFTNFIFRKKSEA